MLHKNCEIPASLEDTHDNNSRHHSDKPFSCKPTQKLHFVEAAAPGFCEHALCYYACCKKKKTYPALSGAEPFLFGVSLPHPFSLDIHPQPRPVVGLIAEALGLRCEVLCLVCWNATLMEWMATLSSNASMSGIRAGSAIVVGLMTCPPSLAARYNPRSLASAHH